jgi:hypothetical protein
MTTNWQSFMRMDDIYWRGMVFSRLLPPLCKVWFTLSNDKKEEREGIAKIGGLLVSIMLFFHDDVRNRDREERVKKKEKKS